MPEEPHAADGPCPEPDEGADEHWQGMPLALDRGHLDEDRSIPPGEETVERPLAELLPAETPTAGARWLARWLLMTGSLALAMAGSAIVLALLRGARPVAWREPLLALYCAIIVLVVRSFLTGGVPAPLVCRRVLAVSGLATAALATFAVVLRSTGQFIHGVPLSQVLTELLAFGILGLAGCAIFFECLRERAWACRTVAAATAVFLLICIRWGAGAGATWREAVDWSTDNRAAAAMAAGAGLLAAGCLVVSRGRGRAGSSGRRLWSLSAGASILVLLLAAATLAWDAAMRHGAGRAAVQAARVATLCGAAGLAPLLLGGLVLSWRRRGPLSQDLRDATGLAWSLVTVAGATGLAVWLLVNAGEQRLELQLVAAIAVTLMVGAWLMHRPVLSLVALGLLMVWLPLREDVARLEMVLISAGVLSAMTVAWYGREGRGWVTHWALMPAVALTVAVLCSLQALTAVADQAGSAAWSGANASAGGTYLVLRRALAIFLWCQLSMGLCLAAAGLIVERHADRSRHAARAHHQDVRLLCGSGWIIAALALAALFAFRAAATDVAAELRSAAGTVSSLVRDLLVLGAGRRMLRTAADVLTPVAAAARTSLGAAVVVTALASVLVVHVVAAGWRRWALRAVAVIWTPVLCVGSAFALVCASRLLLPPDGSAFTTALGRALGTHFVGRALFLAVLVVVLVRLWEALGTAVRAAPPVADAGVRGADATDRATSAHLRFLVGVGVVAGLAGLALSLLLHSAPVGEETAFGFTPVSEFTALATRAGAAGASLCLQVGRLCVAWQGYAAAVMLTLFLLLVLHVEARAGRAEVLPVVAWLWLGLLTVLIAGWAAEVRSAPRPISPGLMGALVGILVLLLMLAGGVFSLLRVWWRLRRQGSPDPAHQRGPDGRGAARSLGTLGVALTLAAGAAVAHGALAGGQVYDRQLALVVAGGSELADQLATLAARIQLWLKVRNDLDFGALALATVSGALLLLHVLARSGARWARAAVCALWAATALGVLGALIYMAHRNTLGQWSEWQILGALALAVLLGRAVVALAQLRRWLPARPG